ncbi:MAG: type II toxin-antitoxin system VapB family antitoxin [Oligoflexia bacterium]|nr:type II toxin-antitoxin system VapB family antitoxin [Oligoflexia bacterium]
MKKAKIFQNGQSQAVRLPKEFRFEGSEVYIQHEGSNVILIPIKKSWEKLKESLNQFSDDFLSERSQPLPKKREGF